MIGIYSDCPYILPHSSLIIFMHVSEVGTDAQGINTRSLSSILESWPTATPKPKVLYTVPVRLVAIGPYIIMSTDNILYDQYGSNPSGVTTSLERRLEVLRLARQHNFLVLEGN